MPEVVMRSYTQRPTVSPTIDGSMGQTILTGSTHAASQEGFSGGTSITVILEGRHADTIIKATDTKVVSAAVAVAAAGALTKTSSATLAGLATVWSLTHSGPSSKSISLGPLALNIALPRPEMFAVSDGDSVRELSMQPTPFFSTVLPSSGVTVLGAPFWDDDPVQFGIIRDGMWQPSVPSRQAQETDVSQPYYLYVGTIDEDARIAQTFSELVREWKAGRSESQSGSAVFLHPAYQKIIGLGTSAVTLILGELERELDHWYWALSAITRDDPVPPQLKGNILAMRECWLAWGRRQGYKW